MSKALIRPLRQAFVNKLLAAFGVLKADAAGVKMYFVVVPCPIFSVAVKDEAAGGKLHPYLVRSACVELYSYQR